MNGTLEFSLLLILSTIYTDELEQLIIKSDSAEHVASNASTGPGSSKEIESSESDVTTSSRCGTGRLSSFRIGSHSKEDVKQALLK